MNRLNVTIGICAYNEEKNIANLLNGLLSQKVEKLLIEEILVISDGSTDRTNEIVKEFSCKNNKIKLVELKERRGKSFAINEILKLAKSSIVVLESADTIPEEIAIETLCLPLRDIKVGATTARAIPLNSSNDFIGFIINLEWNLHHRLSNIKPKFGELIAFRNVIRNITPTTVDEETIAAKINSLGYSLKYVPEARFYKKGPNSIKDFLSQRRRNHAGHLFLYKQTRYKPITLNGLLIFFVLLFNFPKRHPLWVISAILLDILSRILGRFDFLRGKCDYRWKVIPSTKELSV